MKRFRLHPLQILTHVGAWIPLIVLVFDYLNDNLTVNPIQAAQQRTGQIAIVLLILSLACTPINTLFRFSPVLKVRRALGLYAYMYAALHLLIFTGLDFGFDTGLIVDEILKKRFILIGMAAFLLLTLLALTSFQWWMKRMGKKWKQLHRLVYVANLLVVLHYALAVKGDIFRLQGNIIWPLAAAAVVTLLLVLRIRAIRRRLVAQNRSRLQLSKQASVDGSRKTQRPEG